MGDYPRLLFHQKTGAEICVHTKAEEAEQTHAGYRRERPSATPVTESVPTPAEKPAAKPVETSPPPKAGKGRGR